MKETVYWIMLSIVIVLCGIGLSCCIEYAIANKHKVIACPSTNLYLSVEDAAEFNGGIVFRVKGDKIRVMQDGSGCSIKTITVERDK